MSQKTTVCVFARAPVPGRCKTRLAVQIGDVQAARVQRRLTRLALATAVAADVGPVQLWCAPDTSHRFFGECRSRFGVSLHRQAAGGLGRRMSQAIGRCRPCLIIGTDCPALTPDHLQQASSTLAEHADAVFIPAEDGGYVLVGANVHEPRLFRDIQWGSDRVMAQTRSHLKRLGIRHLVAPPLWDVDHPEDLARARRAGFNV